MVYRTQWNNFLKTKINISTSSIESIKQDINEVNLLFNAKYGNSIKPLFFSSLNYIDVDEVDDTGWYDMPIYYSSYKVKDRRIIDWTLSTLSKYLVAYKKLITDNGIKEEENEDVSLTEGTSSTDTTRSYDSDIPQVEGVDDSVLDAMNYLSSASKGINTGTGSRNVSSQRGKTKVSWEEENKNRDMLFKDNLQIFINNIPVLIYNYYSLSTIPVMESYNMFIDYLNVGIGEDNE